MNENQMSPELKHLYDEVEKLVLARDILALQLEISQLRNALKQTNGHTDTEEGEG